MFSVRTMTTAMLALTAMAFAAPAASQTVAEEYIYYPSGPDEYFFFDKTDRKKVVDYKSDRLVRVCIDENRHLVPLSVIHDQDTSTVQPGDCIRVEAKEVRLEPAKRLEPEWVIRARVDTMQAQASPHQPR